MDWIELIITTTEIRHFGVFAIFWLSIHDAYDTTEYYQTAIVIAV